MKRAGLASALALGLACEPSPIPRPADSADARAQVPEAARDTIVRRVVVYRREASAIQRVTGAITSGRAGQRLDSALAIRVLDARGDELGGVRVDWSLLSAANGARLSVINDVTDSAGVSRAHFVSGQSASPQVVAAAVNGVGRIDFEVRVPVANVRVHAPAALWSGETVAAWAQLFDSTGAVLDGGRVQWATTDSSALRVQPSDSQRTLVAGALAGRAQLWAWSGATRGTALLRVRPVLDAEVRALDDSLPHVAVRLVSPLQAEVPRAGHRFRLPVDVEGDHEVVLAITPADRSRLHDARLRIADARHLQDLRVVLIPRRWRIDAGRYEGEERPIDAEAALAPVAGRAPFWRQAPVSGRGLKTLLGWNPARIPIPIAFDRTRSAVPIGPADSAAFWTIARLMEQDLGGRYFRPAELTDPEAVRIEVRHQTAAGHTFVSWTQDGDVNDGTLLFRSSSTLHDPHVVTHELLHLLGFGHSTSWSTVSSPADGREQRLTPEDVAYVQLALRLRRSGLRVGFPRLP